MTDSVRYVNCCKIFKVAQAQNKMICKLWMRKYVPRSQVWHKRAADDERGVRCADRIRPTDKSVSVDNNKLGESTTCSLEAIESSGQRHTRREMGIFIDRQWLWHQCYKIVLEKNTAAMTVAGVLENSKTRNLFFKNHLNNQFDPEEKGCKYLLCDIFIMLFNFGLRCLELFERVIILDGSTQTFKKLY